MGLSVVENQFRHMPEHHLTRKQLYDAVWTTPMCHLAKVYGVTSYTLSKICAEFDIPRPGNDYWPLLRLEYEVEKTPFPPRPANPAEVVKIAPSSARTKPQSASPSSSQSIESPVSEPSAKPAVTKLQPASDFRRAHPLVRAAKELLELGKTPQGGIRHADYAKACLAVHTAKNSLRRGLLIFDAVIRELDDRGYPTQISEERRQETYVAIGDDPVIISIVEKTARRERQLTAEEKQRSYIFDRYTFHPTGKLTFQINEHYPRGGRKSWSDGRHQRLEKFLDEIVEAIIAIGAALKEERLKREEQQRRWAEEHRIYAEKQRKREQEVARHRALEEQAQRWQTAERLREFVQTCRHALAGRNEMGPESAARRWIDWAFLHTDRIDPVRNGWLDQVVLALPEDVMGPVRAQASATLAPPEPA
jgi:hypothetical protein